MPKNCKGCVRYKLLTIYQYAQKPSSAMVGVLFLALESQITNCQAENSNEL